MTRRERVVAVVFFAVIPAVAFAGAADLLGAQGGTSAVAAFAGSFFGSLLRDAVWLRKHKDECAVRAGLAVPLRKE